MAVSRSAAARLHYLWLLGASRSKPTRFRCGEFQAFQEGKLSLTGIKRRLIIDRTACIILPCACTSTCAQTSARCQIDRLLITGDAFVGPFPRAAEPLASIATENYASFPHVTDQVGS